MIILFTSNSIESDDFAQFTYISKMMLEKKEIWKKAMADISKLNWWAKTFKKQLWIVPAC